MQGMQQRTMAVTGQKLQSRGSECCCCAVFVQPARGTERTYSHFSRLSNVQAFDVLETTRPAWQQTCVPVSCQPFLCACMTHPGPQGCAQLLYKAAAMFRHIGCSNVPSMLPVQWCWCTGDGQAHEHPVQAAPGNQVHQGESMHPMLSTISRLALQRISIFPTHF